MSQERKERVEIAQGAAGQFIDLFAGCGGLSLGLMAAEWKGILAVEQDSFAFDSLRHNLIEPESLCPYKYDWPSWLPAAPTEISVFIREHTENLKPLRRQLDLIAGGHPCQGFSLAGRRKRNDPRNGLFRHYVALVEILQPSFVLLENVKGISVAFRKRSKGEVKTDKAAKPFSDRIKQSLEKAGYTVFVRHVRGMDFGVPQFRPRYIMLAIRDDLVESRKDFDPFHDFKQRRKEFLESKKLPSNRPVTVARRSRTSKWARRRLLNARTLPGTSKLIIAVQGRITKG